MKTLKIRHRRLRRTEPLRELFREHRLSARDFILPLFVKEGLKRPRPIASLPGHAQLSCRDAETLARVAHKAGLGGVLLFGIPEKKNESGSGAWREDGVVQQTIARLKKCCPGLVVASDVCLCEYTSHGHCGLLKGRKIDNDATVEALCRTALSHAQAGADIVAPSDRMDGRVSEIRRCLDGAGFTDTIILSYAVKHASAFYGPFREAAQSAPAFGDRRTHQMDPANFREAIKSARKDAAEGADALLVKPGILNLDILAALKRELALPVGVYQVSGEYAAVEAACRNGWMDERAAALETLTAFKRAGADFVITYWALKAARWLKGR